MQIDRETLEEVEAAASEVQKAADAKIAEAKDQPVGDELRLMYARQADGMLAAMETLQPAIARLRKAMEAKDG